MLSNSLYLYQIISMTPTLIIFYYYLLLSTSSSIRILILPHSISQYLFTSHSYHHSINLITSTISITTSHSHSLHLNSITLPPLHSYYQILNFYCLNHLISTQLLHQFFYLYYLQTIDSNESSHTIMLSYSHKNISYLHFLSHSYIFSISIFIPRLILYCLRKY